MTTLEEVLLKLGIDQSQIAPELNAFKAKVAQACHEAAHSFVHVGSAGKAFHKILEDISTESPIVGGLLKLAFEPVVGFMLGAAVTYEYFNRKIEEGNERLEAMAALNKEFFKDIREGARKAAEAVDDLNRKLAQTVAARASDKKQRREQTEHRAELDKINSTEKVEAEKLRAKQQMALSQVDRDYSAGRVGQGGAMARRNQINAEFAEQSRQLEIQGEAARAMVIAKRLSMMPHSVAEAQNALKHSSNALRGLMGSDRLEADKETLESDRAHLARMTEALEKAKDWQQGLSDKPGFGFIGKIAAYLQESSETIATGMSPDVMVRRLEESRRKQADEIQSISKRIHVKETARAKAEGTQGEDTKTVEELKKTRDELKEELRKSNLHLDELKNKPNQYQMQQLAAVARQNLPELSELMTTGHWVRAGYRGSKSYYQPGPFEGAARYANALEQEARYAAAMGRPDIHDQDMLRSGEIKRRLREAGALGGEESVEQSVQEVNQTLMKGITVTVKNVG